MSSLSTQERYAQKEVPGSKVKKKYFCLFFF